MTTKQQALIVDESEAPAPSEKRENVSVPNTGVSGTSDTGLAVVIERLAANPGVDVGKLEKIIELQERILAHEAQSAFNAAFARMQPALPEIDERGKILNKDRSVRSTYARLEDIHTAIKPVLKEHGFAIRHRTEWPQDKPGVIRIVGILSHELGHSEESAFEASADKSDYRTDIQSQGSTVSYGRRYTTLDLLNITTRGVDDDGQKSGRPEPPDTYPDAILKLEAAAAEGSKALDKAWADLPTDIRLYIGKHDAQSYAAIRQRAGQVRK